MDLSLLGQTREELMEICGTEIAEPESRDQWGEDIFVSRTGNGIDLIFRDDRLVMVRYDTDGGLITKYTGNSVRDI